MLIHLSITLFTSYEDDAKFIIPLNGIYIPKWSQIITEHFEKK